MKTVEYVIPLGPDGRRRTRHVREAGEVKEFIVQYEIKIDEAWYPVVRYDTVPGFAHMDRLNLKGIVSKVRLPFSDFNLDLTFAEKDLRDNWQSYRKLFLTEVNKQ